MSLLCHRCGCTLHPGSGDFFLVTIEAVCDPTPPRITSRQLAEVSAESMQKLIDGMRHLSERELMDHVHQKLTIHLCLACYKPWIENPCG